MATVYSDAYWTGSYTYTRVKVEYSGTSATAILLYTRTNTYSGATSTGSPAGFSFGGGWVDMSNKAFYGQQTDTEVCRCTFSISTAGGTYSGSTSGQTLYLSFSGSVTIPAQYSAPSGLSVSVNQAYTNGAKFNVSLSNYGVPSGISGRYIEAAILNQSSYGPTYRYNIAQNTSTSQITVRNNTSYSGSLTIQPNKQYYYGAYASNTAMSTSKVQGQFVTKAEGPTVAFTSATSTTATFTYTTKSDGGYYNKNLQYSLDNGATWNTGTTVTTGTASTGTFTITGLLSGTAYTMKTRVSTNAGTSEGNDVTFDTVVAVEDNKNILYGGGPDNKAKEITRLYGEVGGKAKLITRFYGSTVDPDNFKLTRIVHPTLYWVAQGFTPATFKSKMMADNPGLWDQRNKFDYLEIKSFAGAWPRQYMLWIRFKDNSQILINSGNAALLSSYGVIVTGTVPTPAYATEDLIYIEPKTVAKLAYQGFGHINYS